MRLFVGNRRKDNKYLVTYAFDNGVRIRKILSEETLKEEKLKLKEREANYSKDV